MQADEAVNADVVAEWLRWERFRERCRWQPRRPAPSGTELIPNPKP